MSKRRRKQKNRGENRRRKERAKADASRPAAPYADRVAGLAAMNPAEFAAAVDEALAMPRPPDDHEMAARWARTEARLAEARTRVTAGEMSVSAAVAFLSDVPRPT